jgi:hypothetical protein
MAVLAGCGQLGNLPLGLTGAVTEADLPGIIERMEARLQGRRLRKYADEVWSAAFILLPQNDLSFLP